MTGSTLGLTSTTNYTSTTSGALVVGGGGVGVGGSIWSSDLYTGTLHGTTTTQTTNDTLYLGVPGGAGDNFFLDRSSAGAIIYGYNTTQSSSQVDVLQIYNNSTSRTIIFKVTTAGSGGGSNYVSVPVSTSSTSSNSGALVVAGGVGIGGDTYIGGNLYIQNSPLNYASGTYDSSALFSGIWSSSQGMAMYWTRVGNMVTLMFGGISATVNNTSTNSFSNASGYSLASNAQPARIVSMPVPIVNGGIFVSGYLTISTSGTMAFTLYNGNFVSGIGGVSSCSVSYILN